MNSKPAYYLTNGQGDDIEFRWVVGFAPTFAGNDRNFPTKNSSHGRSFDHWLVQAYWQSYNAESIDGNDGLSQIRPQWTRAIGEADGELNSDATKQTILPVVRPSAAGQEE